MSAIHVIPKTLTLSYLHHIISTAAGFMSSADTHSEHEFTFQNGATNRLIDCLVFYAAFNNISVISRCFLGKFPAQTQTRPQGRQKKK